MVAGTNVSKKSSLQVSISETDSAGHYYALGKVDPEILKKMFESSIRMEIFEDQGTFVYSEEDDRIVYKTSYDGIVNPEAIKGEAEEWIDGLKIAKATTWTQDDQ